MALVPLADLPGRLSAPVRSPAAARTARRALALLPLLLIGAWAVYDWPTVRAGAARLAAADPGWLLAGLCFTGLGWVAAACVRQGAIPERLPPGPLLASQFAAGAANHVLPASIGAHAVTLRFLQRHGVSLTRATSSLALYSLVKPLAKTLVLLVFLVAFPDLLRLGELVPDGRTVAMAAGCAAAGIAAAGLLLAAVRPLRRPVLDFLRTALADARLLHTRPSRVLALWGGAAATPLLQASVIASVGFSLGLPLSWTQVVLALLVASTAAGAVPAPGGIGPVDAALVFTMAAFGAPVDLATTTVVGFRVLTVWVPLLPGALMLSLLVQRNVL
ncbi:YbhN family protein [Streptomyces sp. TRM68367]|uniref:lysylphosphatidylglycerol synthase transmembrane domain-containing protein n=1 Tax=Streptomyces sp. TRM68367 TaxID=2758415 RepID=UPI00165B8564|nr:lysylphosphatidylglycerol synthase transmembrane domain-containing protein [Streptomyces sp. TRM68367]MBC9726260.1 flippase-like domain-containing protein [Streptomyces sp. TRM68367]